MTKSVKLLIAGGLIGIVGMCLPALLIIPKLLQESNASTFLGPAEVELNIKEPGEYYLWNDFRTMYGGRMYQKREVLPDGLLIELRDEDGELMEMEQSNFRVTGGSSKSSAIGVFDLIPGQYRLTIRGDFPKRVFSIGQPKIKNLFATFFIAMAASLLLSLVGGIMFLVGLIRLFRRV